VKLPATRPARCLALLFALLLALAPFPAAAQAGAPAALTSLLEQARALTAAGRADEA
jgi:hypothetical protein